jgi:O-antigen/teichoic acid export membrane protein
VQKLLKISQQTFWQIVVKLITTVSGFIIIGFVSRNYGLSGTGNFTLALTYLAFFYTFADFGFNAHVLGNIDRQWRNLLGTRIVWSIFLTVVAVVVALLLPHQFSPDFKLSVLVGSLIIILFSINVTSSALFQAKHRYDLDIFPTIIGVSIGTLVTVILAKLGMPVYLAILGYVVAWSIHSGATFLASARLIKNVSPLFDKVYMLNLFKDVWPLALTLTLNTIYFRVDSFILNSHFGSEQVGIYNLAYQFFQAILVLPTFAMNSFYPMMLEAMKSKTEMFYSQIKLAAFGLIGFSLVVSAITYFLSPILIHLVSGSGFDGSIKSLQILSLGLPSFFLSSLLWWLMVSKKMYKKLVVVYGIGLIFNITANFVFIPQYSYIAASWITGISEYLILILQLIVLTIYRDKD